jgi:hypothetical protein
LDATRGVDCGTIVEADGSGVDVIGFVTAARGMGGGNGCDVTGAIGAVRLGIDAVVVRSTFGAAGAEAVAKGFVKALSPKRPESLHAAQAPANKAADTNFKRLRCSSG